MTMGTELEPRAGTRRVGVGIVELVPEEVAGGALSRLRDNVHDRVLVLLVAILVAAQAADVVTTYRALWGRNLVEENPLFRTLLQHSAVGGFSVKLLLVATIAVLVLTTLRGRRAAVALALAASISLTAPVLNFLLLMRG